MTASTRGSGMAAAERYRSLYRGAKETWIDAVDKEHRPDCAPAQGLCNGIVLGLTFWIVLGLRLWA